MAGTDGGLDPTPGWVRTNAATLAAGLGAYLLSLGVVALVSNGIFGGGAWGRVSSDLSGVILLHSGASVPLWNGTIHVEMLPATAALFGIVAGAGFAVTVGTTRSPRGETAFWSGGAILTGYLPPTAVAGVYLVRSQPTVEALTMIAPVLLAGGLFPVVAGGAGGRLAAELRKRTDDSGTEQ